MKKTTLVLALGFLLTASAKATDKTGHIALTGGVVRTAITWLGPLMGINIKLGIGAEYWLTDNWALKADLGLGSEGYGTVIGTTSESLVNMRTGDFVLDPGITGTFALSPLGHFTLYSALRVGFPLRSGYPGALSLGPTVGTLIAINDWAALDLAVNASVVANFKFTYLATILSFGSIGFRIFI